MVILRGIEARIQERLKIFKAMAPSEVTINCTIMMNNNACMIIVTRVENVL